MREREREREREQLWARIFYGIVVFYIFFTFIFYAAYPMQGDVWVHAETQHSSYPFVNYYTAGRNISYTMELIFPQALGAPLGYILNDTILGIKLGNALGCTLILWFFWFISSLYIPKNYRRAGFILFILLSFFLPYYSLHHIVLEVYGGFAFALGLWYFLYRMLKNRPLLQIENPYKEYGLWLALCFIGTHIQDTGNFVAMGLSIMTLFYLFLEYFGGNNSLKKSKKISLYAGTHLAFGVLALVHNMISQFKGRSSLFTIDLHTIYLRLIAYDFIIDLSLIFALIFIFYYGIGLIRKKCSQDEYLTFSMLSVGLGIALFSCIIGTYFDQAIWVIWIAFTRISFAFYKKSNRFVLLLLPLGYLWLFIGGFVKLHPKISEIRRLNERPTVEFFQKADREGKEELSLSKEELGLLGINVYSWGFYPNIPSHLYRLGLISKPIKITLVENKAEE